MRNVSTYLEHRAPFGTPDATLGGSCSQFLCNLDTNTVCHVARDGEMVVVKGESSVPVMSLAFLRDERELDISEDAIHVIGVEYVAELDGLVLALAGGEIVIYPSGLLQEHPDNVEAECVGCISEGLTAMAWSPEQELVVFGTGAGTLVTMTKEFDVMVENPVLPPASEDTQAMTIRWRKDGQFYAVASATAGDSNHRVCIWDRKGEFKTEAGSDPKLPRPSGPANQPLAKMPCQGIQKVIEWFPDCSLLATVVWSPAEKVTRMMFCLINGDRHGECVLGREEVEVVDMRWSPVTALHKAAFCVLVKSPSLPHTVARLYSRSNYHWYVKKQWDYSAGTTSGPMSATAVTWGPNTGGVLYVATPWGVTTNHLVWTISGAQNVVGVVDGQIVKVTDFAKGVVPPPMSHYHLTLPQNKYASDLAMVQTSTPTPPGSLFAAVLSSQGDVFLFAKTSRERHPPQLPILPSAFLPAGQVPALRRARLLTFVPQANLLAFTSADVTGLSLVYLKGVIAAESGAEPVTFEAVHVSIVRTSLDVVAISHDPVSGTVVWQVQDGSVASLKLSDIAGYPASRIETVPTRDVQLLSKLPEICYLLCTVPPCGIEVTPRVVGLSPRQILYVDGTEVERNCNTFSVSQNAFLLYTTTANRLHIQLLSNPQLLSSYMSLPVSDPKTNCEVLREVEQGAILVCSVDPTLADRPAITEGKVVLQMPRGNLETVHPRPLVLSTIKSHINLGEYGLAFTLLRRHRIDLNVLIDHNPTSLLGQCSKVVNQMTIPSLTLFISSIVSTDVIKESFAYYSLLPAAAPQTDEEEVPEGLEGLKSSQDEWKQEEKTNLVCRQLRAAMQEAGLTKYVQPIIGSYVQETPPACEQALDVVRDLRKQPVLRDVEDTAPVTATWEVALKHLIFLMQDINILYNCALGMYEYDLVLAIGSKSQKDPKEYRPFLAKLQELPPNVGRFKVDMHLGHWSKAIAHALDCEGAEYDQQFLTLVSSHALYTEALRLLRAKPGQEDQATRFARLLPQVLTKYGDYLDANMFYSQAGHAYMEANAIKDALDCFVKAGDVAMALALSHRLNHTKPEQVSMVKDLVEVLAGSTRIEEAANLLKSFCNDPERAIMMLIEAHHWLPALSMAIEVGRHDLVVTSLKDAVLEDYEAQREEIKENTDLLAKYLKRLSALKAKGIARMAANGDTETMSLASMDQSSVAASSLRTGSKSIASSKHSTRTGISYNSQFSKASKSTTSSKKTMSKKDKKKLYREGSEYEEANIKRDFFGIMPQPAVLTRPIQGMIKLLLFLGHINEACTIQNEMQSYIDVVEGHIPTMSLDLGTTKHLELPEYVQSPAVWGEKMTTLMATVKTTQWKVVIANT